MSFGPNTDHAGAPPFAGMVGQFGLRRSVRIFVMNPDHSPSRGFGVELPYLVGKTTHQATETATEQGIKNIRVLKW